MYWKGVSKMSAPLMACIGWFVESISISAVFSEVFLMGHS